MEWWGSFYSDSMAGSPVRLLITGRGTNGSQAIQDASIYSTPITVFGNTSITTSVADPFGQNNGVLTFDGSGDYLRTPILGEAFNTTAAHTLEFFFRYTATGTRAIFNKGGGAESWTDVNGLELNIFLFGGLLYTQFRTTGTTFQSITVAQPAVNTWNHYAVTFDGTNTRAFLGGVLSGAVAQGRAMPANGARFTIGAASNNTAEYAGQLSNIRFRQGALYTANFTPPAAPFTS